MGMEKKIEDRFEGASPAASPPSLLLREKNRRCGPHRPTEVKNQDSRFKRQDKKQLHLLLPFKI
jgi:hypothetical protein